MISKILLLTLLVVMSFSLQLHLQNNKQRVVYDYIKLVPIAGQPNYANCDGVYVRTTALINNSPIWTMINIDNKHDGRFIFRNPDGKYVITAAHYLGSFVQANDKGQIKTWGGFHSSKNGNTKLWKTQWDQYTVQTQNIFK